MATQYETIGLERLKGFLDDNDAEVINVLGTDQFEKQHIPGSWNAPVDAEDFGDLIRERVPDRETPIAVYCADEDCGASPRAAKKLTEMGFDNVFDFEGGMKEWVDAGLDVEGETQTMEADITR